MDPGRIRWMSGAPRGGCAGRARRGSLVEAWNGDEPTETTGEKTMRNGRRRWASGWLLWIMVFLVAGLPAPGRSQEVRGGGTVEGIVRSREGGAPLAGVLVEVVGREVRALSDGSGRFRVGPLPPGSVTLRVVRMGFRARTVAVVVGEGRTDVGVVWLETAPVELSPLVVLTERTRMVGDPLDLKGIPGAAHYLSREDLEAQRLPFDDIQTFLRLLPGVNVQDEEGFGRRPNIGLRGTGLERSSKITLMEDGVLIAPAPYAAPAAYYFPVVGRMEGVEVRKGSSQVKYGPRTTGGAVNLVTAPIPDRTAWTVDVGGGGYGTLKARSRIGGSSGAVGWLLETYQIGTDGFKVLPGGGETGFRLGDYMGKLRFRSREEAPVYQELELKAGYTEEGSNETYLGLTEVDFRVSPLLRYPASRRDRLDAEHRQIQARYFLRPSGRWDLTTTLYRNDFHRNWYKLQSVRGVGIAKVLAAPETYGEELAILRGGKSEEDALRVRANNRTYRSMGLQSVLGFRFGGGGLSHEVEVGLRLHRDEEDRFQWEDGYRMELGSMIRTSGGTPGSQSNRVSEARALALYLQDEVRAGPWTVVPGVRFETIRFRRTDFGPDDPERREPTRIRETRVSALVPGVGVTFAVTPSTHLFAGVHRGFGPPGPGAAQGTRPEESVNYELGARLRSRGLAVQLTGFRTDYSNILGKATLATGESGAGELFNGGRVDVRGLELSVDYDLAWGRGWGVRLPLRGAYTLTRARFLTSFESAYEPWGTVSTGDELPYIPRHQFSSTAGVEGRGWKITLSAFGSSPMRTRAGQGPRSPRESTDGFLVLNLGGEVTLPGRGVLYLGVQNLLDERYVAARRPAGARPGLPRTVLAGVRVRR